jgi:autotransporter-associated beta strand protein
LSHVPGNNDDYRGPITLGSDATIYNANNVLSLFGLVDNAGHELRLVSDASNIEIENAGGITGAGDVVADGVNGRIVVFNNTKNDFDGLLTVNHIIWDARSNDALGSTNGTTIVNNGGRLEVRDGKTLADDITIYGTDNNAGAIRGINNVNTLSGTITLGSDALIWINTGQVTLSGDLAGPFQAIKQGSGTLVLDGDKTLDTVVPLAGTLQVNSVGGFGQTANLFVPQGATVAFEGDLNFDGTTPLQTFKMGGGGLASISQTTTISIPLNLGLESGVILGGAGDLVIDANLGTSGVVTSMPPFALNHYGFHTNDQNVLNLDAGGGIWNGGAPTYHPAYFGEALLTTGPANRGLDFNNDADFSNTGAVGQPDNYQNLWIGYVHCNQTGTWGFRNAGDDDRAGIWLDLNTNGVFESSVPGLGSNRGEQLSWEDGVNKQVTLTNGVRYLVAFTHMEFGGPSRADFRFTPPSDPERVINPLGQAGRWSPVSGLVGLAENELSKEGSGTVYLNGDNGYGEGSTILGGALVPANVNALGGNDADLTILGGSLVLSGGIALDLGSVEISGTGGQGWAGAIANLDGDNLLSTTNMTAGYSLLASPVGIGSGDGRLTIDAGQLDLQYNPLVFSGAGDIIFNPDIVSSAVVVPPETNILYHLGFHHSGDQNVVMDLDDNGGMMGNGNPVSFPGFFAQVQLTDGPGSRGLDFNNDANFRNAGAVGQNDYYANLWLGNFHCNQTGTWGFRNAGDDDRAGIWLDTDQDGVFESSVPGLGQNRGEQLTWENGGNKTVDLVAGQRYMIAFTHMEFAGGSRADFRFTSPGGGETIIKPSDPAQTGLWNGFEQVPDNTVSKNGSGTVTLNGSNTHTDETIINEGSLVIIAADGLGTSDAGTLIYENGTLGLSNSVTLAGESLVLEGHITSLGGSNVIALASGITVSSNATTIGLGAEAGSLTVEPDINLEYAALSVSGEGSTTLNGSLSGLGTGASRPAYADEVLSDAPLLYYQLNETAGTLVANSGTTGATDDGTVFDTAHTDLNVPSLNPTLGTAAAFDDNIATGITTPFSVNGLSNQYTIEAWVMSPGPQNNRSGIAGQNDAYEFGMRDGSNIELWNPGSGAFVAPYPTGEWFHVVATGDGSTRRVYVNGVEVASDADAVTDYGNSGFFFNIGGRGIQDAGNNAFNGFIDEVALYDKALAAADILRHYDARDAIGADNAVLKTGGGTLTLAAANTNDGQTRASGGILMVQGSTGSSNVIVSAGAVLSGSGVVGGDIQVLTRGETNPGASPGTLTGNGDLVYANYSSVFNAELESAVSADQLAIGGDIVLNNATLHLLRDAGYNPTATDVLTIATGTSVNGTFNGIAEGQRISAQGAEFVVSYLGNAITLNATAGLYTYAGPDTLTRPPGEDLSVPAGDLLANDLVGDGVGPLVITGVISNALEGGSVNFDGSSVTYAPPTNGYDGVDSFTYTMSDGTDSAIGLVTVVTGEAPPSGAAVGDLGGTVRLPGGDYRIAFSGDPGESYDIEWTQDLAAIPVVWQVLGTVVAAGDGSILLDHLAPPDGANYYRAALK